MEFGVFDHIEPVENLTLNQIYELRLQQLEIFDENGFYAYHLAEHHSPAVHSLAPSQNVFLAAASQRTSQLKLAPCVYVLPLHHPLRLIEEISMLDHLSGGRIEIGVGRGGVMEAYFWGQEADSETNYQRYLETLEILKTSLDKKLLTFKGKFNHFDELPMRLNPIQKPYPPMWYMRNAETAAIEKMNTVVVGTLESLKAETHRYKRVWESTHGTNSKTDQGTDPKVGLVVHMVIAETDEKAIELATPAWEQYRWNLAAPRRIEAEKRGLTQFQKSSDGSFGFVGDRPKNLPNRETRKDIEAEIERFDQQSKENDPTRLGGVALAGSPDSVRRYMEEYIETGANYFMCSFQWGNLSHDTAIKSIDLFTKYIMPQYK
ncbi:MAG: LLM class flavin-dependent oxidoreductase [Dehalococcoidia bacterium]|nr:LLM class flavin-dependent oxidoreductase [Chloroflexota bacterium]MBI50987.1 LLM class flavin-dependent oxidoreductase [Chloroflexota bacterium]MBR98023.1 LLM class flavin-dependent oxidoreductase [Dehalococcoidia bacterium]